jgi:hypothetical protein
MPQTTSTPSGVTSAGYVPRFARNDGAYADSVPVVPSTVEVPRIAPELITQVMTLEAANEARRVIADARRRLAEIAARASQAPLVLNPDEAPPPAPEPAPTLHALTARRTPPTLRAPSPTLRPLRPVRATAATTSTRQDPPARVQGAGSTGLSREYEWEQAVKAPFERVPAAPPTSAAAGEPVRRATRRTGQSREYEWEQAVKAPYQAPPQSRPANAVLELLRSAAFQIPAAYPDRRSSAPR